MSDVTVTTRYILQLHQWVYTFARSLNYVFTSRWCFQCETLPKLLLIQQKICPFIADRFYIKYSLIAGRDLIKCHATGHIYVNITSRCLPQ